MYRCIKNQIMLLNKGIGSIEVSIPRGKNRKESEIHAYNAYGIPEPGPHEPRWGIKTEFSKTYLN